MLSKRNDGQHIIEITPLIRDEKKRLIRDYLLPYSKKLGHQEEYQLVEHPATSSPIYLRAILEQLRLHGSFEDLSKEVERFLACKTVPQLFEVILQNWERDYNTTECPSLVKVITTICMHIHRHIHIQT